MLLSQLMYLILADKSWMMMHVAMLIFRGSLETRTCIARDLFYESLTFLLIFVSALANHHLSGSSKCVSLLSTHHHHSQSAAPVQRYPDGRPTQSRTWNRYSTIQCSFPPSPKYYYYSRVHPLANKQQLLNFQRRWCCCVGVCSRRGSVPGSCALSSSVTRGSLTIKGVQSQTL